MFLAILENMIAQFDDDPASNQYQEGYLAALLELRDIARETEEETTSSPPSPPSLN